MDIAIKLIMLLLFFGVMIYVGFYCRKHSTDVNGFVLGGRNVGPWLTAFAYGTSYFSAVIFVGYAGQFGWKFGIASTWVGIGNAMIGSLLAWVILGRRTRIMTQHLSSATMPDFFEKRFNAPSLKVAASIIIFIFMIPYTASLYNGLSRLFRMAFNIDYSVCVIVMAALTAVYVIVGGYMATAVNDFIQGLIMLVGIVAVIAAVLGSKGGFMESLNGLAAVKDETIANGTVSGVFNSFFGPDPFSLLGVVLLTSLGTWGLPQMVGKFYAIKSEGSIHKGTVISTVFAMIVAGGCYFLGGFGRLFSAEIGVTEAGTPVGGFDNVIPTMLQTLSPFLIAIVIILVLSASMSTLSSLVLTSSSTVTLDLLKGRVIKDMDEKRLHRPGHGCQLGRHGRRVPGALPLWPVLEADHEERLLGVHAVLNDLHDHRHAGQPEGPEHQPRHSPVPDQRRRLLHDRGPRPRSAGQPDFESPRQSGSGADLQLLQPQGRRHRNRKVVVTAKDSIETEE